MSIRTKNKIRIYHGSPDLVKEPEIRRDESRHMDFGYGFYCTTSPSQATKWTRTKLRRHNKTQGYVNEYEFTRIPEGLIIKDFGKDPSIEWLDFVVANRTDSRYDHPFDIVFGPVADDDAFASIETYIAEKDYSFERKMELIKTLKTYKLRDQILFHTTASLERIKFAKAKIVEQRQAIVLPVDNKGKRL